MAAIVFRPPAPGSPAPRFIARTDVNERFVFDTVAGRYIVLGFVGSAGLPHAQPALDAVAARAGLFDVDNRLLFWVTCDPADKAQGRLSDHGLGIKVFWDFDSAVSQAWGVAAPAGDQYAPTWFILDPQLRVMAVRPMAEVEGLFADLARLPSPGLHAGLEISAPVLILPRVFEPALCQRLIAHYRDGEASKSGFMRQVGGKTVLMSDPKHKRRKDVTVTDPELLEATRLRLSSRLAPEVERVFQFKATRIERYIVACYDAAEAAHFKPHRDNTTAGTAHRRFAVTINLNAEDYEGGDLAFPEFGPRTYRAPTGGAVVFSCSLLHEVRPMTRGQRFAFLPFLYDDAAAAVRQANLGALAPDPDLGAA